jgi:2-polyprenyl-3-methyl-5-hydroxy-6-metoxy-1,4-benzoquinol methylase
MEKDNNLNYLAGFGDLTQLPRSRLLAEMDCIWEKVGLNNRLPLSTQMTGVAAFYSHPVWILNGLFSEYDSVSNTHRKAIARYIKKIHGEKIADYGGGSGVLARFVSEELPTADMQIIEPFESTFFVERLKDLPSIKFVAELSYDYDVVIAQDVLEHVDNPLNLAVDLIQATKMGGHLIFANCFYPDIKCHLPATFYLRYTFSGLMRFAGLALVGRITGAEHALVFKRIAEVNYHALGTADRIAKLIGPMLNWARGAVSAGKRWVKALR